MLILTNLDQISSLAETAGDAFTSVLAVFAAVPLVFI